MNKIILSVVCIGVITVASNLFGEMNPEMKKTRDFFRKTCQLAKLSNNVSKQMPKGSFRDLTGYMLGGVINISNMGLDTTDLIGERKLTINGNEINIDVLNKRLDCLLKDDAVLKAAAKDYDTAKGLNLSAGCPGLGCVNTDACFALAMRDVIYLTKPIIENLVAKVIIDPQTGEPTGDIQRGLFLNFNAVILQALDVFTKKSGVGEQDDVEEGKKIAKSQKMWSSMASRLEGIKKLSKMADGVAKLFAQTFAVFVPAMDIATLIIGGDVVLDFMYIPEMSKSSMKEAGFEKVDITYNSKTIEKDFKEIEGGEEDFLVF